MPSAFWYWVCYTAKIGTNRKRLFSTQSSEVALKYQAALPRCWREGKRTAVVRCRQASKILTNCIAWVRRLRQHCSRFAFCPACSLNTMRYQHAQARQKYKCCIRPLRCAQASSLRFSKHSYSMSGPNQSSSTSSATNSSQRCRNIL